MLRVKAFVSIERGTKAYSTPKKGLLEYLRATLWINEALHMYNYTQGKVF